MRRTVALARRHSRATRGFVLIAGMLFLLVLTILSLSMFRGFGLQERIAGNTRDRQRAFEAAQSALQYGEWWLTQGTGGTGVACSSVVTVSASAPMGVCSNALANPTTLPWAPARYEVLPSGMTVAAGGGVAADGDIKYQGRPGLYIYYLGMSADGLAQLYQVTSFGYGGNADTAVVLRSTYQMKNGVQDLGAGP